MSKRITITCSEKDKVKILDGLGYICPFDPYPDYCGEDSDCGECMEDNIEFIVTEGCE